MGWTSFSVYDYATRRKPNGSVDRKATLDYCLFMGQTADSRYRHKPIKSAMVGSTYYAAVELIDKIAETRQVYCLVCLTSIKDDEFYYKDMTDSMGPNKDECPIGILNLLTQTDNTTALEWRQRCRDNARNRRCKKWYDKLEYGGRAVLTLYNGEQILLEKRPPNHQFKRWWWYCPETGQYMPRSRVDESRLQPCKKEV